MKIHTEDVSLIRRVRMLLDAGNACQVCYRKAGMDAQHYQRTREIVLVRLVACLDGVVRCRRCNRRTYN